MATNYHHLQQILQKTCCLLLPSVLDVMAYWPNRGNYFQHIALTASERWHQILSGHMTECRVWTMWMWEVPRLCLCCTQLTAKHSLTRLATEHSQETIYKHCLPQVHLMSPLTCDLVERHAQGPVFENGCSSHRFKHISILVWQGLWSHHGALWG